MFLFGYDRILFENYMVLFALICFRLAKTYFGNDRSLLENEVHSFCKDVFLFEIYRSLFENDVFLL